MLINLYTAHTALPSIYMKGRNNTTKANCAYEVHAHLHIRWLQKSWNPTGSTLIPYPGHKASINSRLSLTHRYTHTNNTHIQAHTHTYIIYQFTLYKTLRNSKNIRSVFHQVECLQRLYYIANNHSYTVVATFTFNLHPLSSLEGLFRTRAFVIVFPPDGGRWPVFGRNSFFTSCFPHPLHPTAS